MKFSNSYVLILLMLGLTGCNSNLDFAIEFDQVNGLKKGDSLTHQQQVIGKVRDIKYTDDGMLQVLVSVDDAYRYLATKDAMFAIAPQSIQSEKSSMVIELIANLDSAQSADLNSEKGLISEDDVIKGVSSLKAFSQKLENQFSKALQNFSQDLSGAWEDWKENTLDAQITYLENELDELLEELSKADEDLRDHLKKEVIPSVKKQLEALTKQLEAYNRQKEQERLEKKWEKVEKYTEV